MVALAIALMSTAWAQPKFKILATVPGGLSDGLTFDVKGNLYGTTRGGGDHNWSTRADGRGRPSSISDPTYFRAGT